MKNSKIIEPENISVLKELEAYIVPLSKEESHQLEQNIISEGCREPLIVWKHEEKYILLDGHNRFKICKKHAIPFKVEVGNFTSIDDAKEWMINNQLGRRNLTPDQMSYYRGLKYDNMKRKKGGYEYIESKGQKEQSTSDKLAQEFKVSESTVKRDAKFAQGLEVIGKGNPKLKMKILSGEIKVKKSDIQTLSKIKEDDTIIIKNEADLYNKAKLLRDETIKEIERELKEVEEKKIEEAQEILKQSEPIFLEKDERIQRIKANIISSINAAINKRDHEAIIKIKSLIEKLENELFY